MADSVDDELVNNFQAITHASEENARMYLAAADSDLQNAVEMFFAANHGEEAQRPDNASISQANAQPASTGTQQIPDNRAPQRPQPRRRGPFGFVLRTIGVIFSSALNVADWIVGLVLPTGAYRSLRGLLSRFIGGGNIHGEALPIALRRQYGESILTFGEGTWQDALAAAAQLRRPLLLYIHSPEHINTPNFCETVLCDPRITAYARSHFITWASEVGTPGASQLTDLLRISSFPYLAVLATSSSPSAAASTSTTIHRRPQALRMLASIDGAASADAVLRALEGAVAAASASTRGATRRATAAAEARSVRQEQDAALAASMAEDRRRAQAAEEERRRAEAARQAEEDARRADEEAKQRREQTIEDRRNAVIARRAEKQAQLPAEPECSSEGCALIRVKLPQGASTQRRFPSGATVGDMYDWVDSLDEIEALDYVLTSTFPRKEYPRGEAGALLSDVGLVPNAALMVIVEDE